MLKYLRHLAAASTVAFVAGCGGSDGPTLDIVQQAQSDPRLSILVEAVSAADLAQTLSGPGPFTVLAPTNDAFVALLQELGVTKAQLLGNKALLTTVLTYHVVPGRIERSQLPVNVPVFTVQGQSFTVSADGVVTDQRSRTARIVQADVLATNGVVHVIDRVVLPRP